MRICGGLCIVELDDAILTLLTSSGFLADTALGCAGKSDCVGIRSGPGARLTAPWPVHLAVQEG